MRIEMANDYCTKDGAGRLKELIREYWLRKGFDVDVKLVNEGFVPAMRSARTDIRSNLVNGMPGSGGAAQLGEQQSADLG